ncbi:MAG TPA: cyclic nucleotide-binding domain-containing protein [Azospirillaceae bacterium]|nr:cyclic nucleotide-binding domain-containing protein [Azospirillaceae bacterium]
MATALDGVELFDAFSREERAAVAARGRVVDVPAGAVLVRQDDDADALFVLLDGEVRVLRWDASGGEVEIGRRHSGECFGEMAMIDGGQRSATVETVSPCRLFVLSRQDFHDVIAPSPAMLSKLLRELSLKIRDVSERVVQEDLDRRTHAAEAELARHRAITQAVTGLAHELNTPLGVCITAASHLAGALPPQCREAAGEAVDLLVDNLKRCAGLMETFTTIAALHDAEPLEPLDLVDVISHAAALFAMDRPDARLEIRMPAAAAIPWLGYRGHLERVLRQIFDNAAIHAYGDAPIHADGGEAPARRLDVEAAPDRLGGRPALRVTLRDYGGGLPDEPARKLFEAFYTTKRARGCKGLGLTIVYNAVTGPLCGRVWIEPADDGRGGACVTLLLPREL